MSSERRMIVSKPGRRREKERVDPQELPVRHPQPAPKAPQPAKEPQREKVPARAG